MHTTNRRAFIARAAAATAGFMIVPRHVLGGTGFTAPSDQLTTAIIGVGGMGRGHFAYEGRLLAVCDVDRKHLDDALAAGGKDVKGYSDYREVLQRQDIDVVHIATPPHWHALMAVEAARAGKDIWCEKPMTRTIGEGVRVVEEVNRYGRIFRLNTWFRFKDTFYGLGTDVKPLKKVVESGVLGWPLTFTVSGITGYDWKFYWSGQTNLKPQPVPPELDYEMWLGPAPYKPYNVARVHANFRSYWDYDGGGLGDMGQHYLDPVQYLLNKDGTSPVEVEAWAPWPPHPDAVRMWGRVEMKYADGCRIILESCEWGRNETEGQPYIEGPKGKLYPGMRSDPPDIAQALKTLPEPEPQVSDFNVSVRTRRKFGLNEVNGNRSNMLVHIANAAIRTGRKLRFDPVAQRFIGDDFANRLVDQPMRAPWRL